MSLKIEQLLNILKNKNKIIFEKYFVPFVLALANRIELVIFVKVDGSGK